MSCEMPTPRTLPQPRFGLCLRLWGQLGCGCYTVVTASNVSLGEYAGGTFGPVTLYDTHYTAVSAVRRDIPATFPKLFIAGLAFLNHTAGQLS